MPSSTETPAAQQPPKAGSYRGRIAPTPTGLLHLGHARTFQSAWQRARAAGGTLVYRQEDLDPARCTPAFAQAAVTDLRRYGLDWDEGPDCTPQGPHAPYCQSQRTGLYRAALAQLIRSGHAYPSSHSRSDLARALASGLARPAPPLWGEQDSEAIFPLQWRAQAAAWFANAPLRERIARALEAPTGTTNPIATATGAANAAQTPQPVQPTPRPATGAASTPQPATVFATDNHAVPHVAASAADNESTTPAPAFATDNEAAGLFAPGGVNWRFSVPEGEVLRFTDATFGAQNFTACEDFGDFVLWRRDGVPAYELAVVVDDIAMGITEVVRGADLLRSTARQLLLYRALGSASPAFCHCPLLLDPQSGERLAKRSQSLSLRALLDSGAIRPI